MLRTWIVIVVCALAGMRVARAGEVATDAKRGIRLQVPDGYGAFPEGMSLSGAIFSYARGEPGAAGFELLGVSALGGTIGRESFDPTPIVQQMAKGLGLTVVQSARRAFAWKGFELDGFVATMRQGDVIATLAGVQVPVRAEAVQIIIMRLDDKEVGSELAAVLAGFDAESSWLGTEERVRKAVVGGLTFLAILSLVAYRVIRRRRAKRAA